jgi:hypothetical protein
METEGLLRCSKLPTACTYPEPVSSNRCPIYLRSVLLIFSHLRLYIASSISPLSFCINFSVQSSYFLQLRSSHTQCTSTKRRAMQYESDCKHSF